MQCRALITLDLEELAEQLVDTEAKKLIVDLEANMQDWDFTLELAQHFVGLLKDGVGQHGLDEEYINWLKD